MPTARTITCTHGNFNETHLRIDASGNGILDANAVEVFTRGQCHALAVALHDATGWPIVALSYSNSLSDWDHACVQHPDGDLIDIEGRGALARWHGRCDIPVHTDADYLINSGYPIHDDAAEAFARTVLAAL